MLHHLLADAVDSGVVAGAPLRGEQNTTPFWIFHVAHVVVDDVDILGGVWWEDMRLTAEVGSPKIP